MARLPVEPQAHSCTSPKRGESGNFCRKAANERSGWVLLDMSMQTSRLQTISESWDKWRLGGLLHVEGIRRGKRIGWIWGGHEVCTTLVVEYELNTLFQGQGRAYDSWCHNRKPALFQATKCVARAYAVRWIRKGRVRLGAGEKFGLLFSLRVFEVKEGQFLILNLIGILEREAQ